MTAAIAAAGAAFTAWLGYMIGDRLAERRAAAEMARYRWRLNHPTTYDEVTR